MSGEEEEVVTGTREGNAYMERLGEVLDRLVNIEDRRRPAHVRPKAIPSRVFKIGENWPNFSLHFVECVRAAYGFANTDTDALNAACLSWLPSKLEPGPTLIAYNNLGEADKTTWPRLNNALTTIFADETEREKFLADTASFKRGKRSLLEYRTELSRLMDTHLPELRHVDREYQRQITSRFIEGLEGDELKRDLRKHCKRDKNTLEEAYNTVVDWESAEVQSRIREGESAALTPEVKSLSILERPKVQTVSNNPVPNNPVPNNTGNQPVYRKLQNEVESIASKQKISEMHIQELMAKSAHTADRVDTVSKEVNQISERMTNLEKTVGQGFERMEQILTNNSNQMQNRNYGNQQYNANPFGNFRPYGNRGMNRGNFRGQAPNIRPSITGGPGYADAAVRPRAFRMQEQGSNVPVRPASATHPGTFQGAGTASPSNDASNNAAAAADAAAATEHPRTNPGAQCYDESGWWSPGMQQLGAMGYDDGYDGTYSYGGQDFYWQ